MNDLPASSGNNDNYDNNNYGNNKYSNIVNDVNTTSEKNTLTKETLQAAEPSIGLLSTPLTSITMNIGTSTPRPANDGSIDTTDSGFSNSRGPANEMKPANETTEENDTDDNHRADGTTKAVADTIHATTPTTPTGVTTTSANINDTISRIQQQQQQQHDNSVRTNATDAIKTLPTQQPDQRHGGGIVPRLDIIPKPYPIPPFQQVKEWMSTDGNQTAGQFMLDFAVLGFAKCGTSTMMLWLGNQPEIFVPPYEITVLKNKPTWELIKAMYDDGEEKKGDKKDNNNNNNSNNNNNNNNNNTHDANHTALPQRPLLLHGFKSPNDIMDTRPARILREYFSKTKIILGLRHPILMIESFYNHRIQNGLTMPPLEKLPYKNMGFSHLVTLGRAAYHANLIHLGKTNLTSKEEWMMIPKAKRRDMAKNNIVAYPPSDNPVYLYETAQLSDTNKTRVGQVLRDLQNFLGLSQPLDPPLHYSPGKTHESDEKQRLINSKKADICDERYEKIRHKLIKIGTTAQEWIVTYFLQSPDVYVSNIDHFRSILEGYKIDPCLERRGVVKKNTNSNSSSSIQKESG